VLKLKGDGKGIFLSSHILSEVERLCDRVGIIREGALVEVGTLAELRHLTRVLMNVTSERPIDGLEGVKGVHEIAERQDGLSFQVDSDEVGNVLSSIARFGIKKLESMPPTLEDLFMRHYHTEGGA